MGITLFLAHKKIFQNKLSEIVNNKLKMLVVLIVLRKDTQGLCALNKTQPSQFKQKSNTTKFLSQEYRQWLFASEYFKLQASTLIQKAMNEYNYKELTEGITKQEAEYLNTKIEDKTLETMTLVNSKDVCADAVKNANINNIKEVQTQLTNILTSNDNIYEKSH